MIVQVLAMGMLFITAPEAPPYEPVVAPVVSVQPGAAEGCDYGYVFAIPSQGCEIGEGGALEAGEWIGDTWVGIFWDGAELGIRAAF